MQPILHVFIQCHECSGDSAGSAYSLVHKGSSSELSEALNRAFTARNVCRELCLGEYQIVISETDLRGNNGPSKPTADTTAPVQPA